jgi:ribose transport system substrate-binding protein
MSIKLCTLVMVITCATGILPVGGCNPKSESNTKNAAVKPTIVSKRNLSQIKVGYCSPSLNASFYVALAKAVKANAESYGMQFISADGQGDITRQITGIEDMVAKGVKILIINPLDYKALVSTVNAATQAGVAVFILDSYIDPAAHYVSSVFANNTLNGELVGEWVADKMAGKKINAAIISGNQGNQAGKEKRLGFMSGLAEGQLRTQGKTDFNIISQGWGGWANNEGLKAMEDILSAHPGINVLMAENDAMAIGALRAVKELGKETNIMVVGFDGQKEALKLIRQDKYGAAALNSPDRLGKLVVESAVRYLNGDKYLDKVMYTQSVLIDKNNVNQFYDEKAAF